MRVMIEKNEVAMSMSAAGIVAGLVERRRRCVLGLATGATPVGLYKELVRMHKDQGLDFSRVMTFNLDEYLTLPADHPQSYRVFMNENLFHHVNIDMDRTYVPDGCAEDIEEYCQVYEKMILDAGGIDIQILGLGCDGHIGFNEPGSALRGRTGLAVLARQTIADNSRFFKCVDEVPELAISMGCGTILDARQILLLACGVQKAEAVHRALEGPVSASCPASALQLHEDAIAVIDEQAASLLEWSDHYRHAEEVRSRFKDTKLAVSQV